MLGYVYGKDQVLNTNQDLGVKVATPVGTIFGQLLFGWLADHVGRKRMCKHTIPFFTSLIIEKWPLDGVELIIIIIGSFGQALAGEAQAVNILAVIIMWRFVVCGILNSPVHSR
jgi:MFS transporter, PHS family, inorganic phosphate transporter